MSKNEITPIDNETKALKAFQRIFVSNGFERLTKMVLDGTPNEVLGAELTSMVQEVMK